MTNLVNKNHIFNICCISLIVTAMTFAIRAGILGDLALTFGLNSEELGWINAMAFLGFPVATIIGGALYNFLGARKLLFMAFTCHLIGLVLTISAGGFWTLLISTFCIGFANGSVEAGCNPLIADLHPTNKTIMLNKFHVWFPGGIVIGALISNLMTYLGFDWQLQIAVIIVPTLIYGVLLVSCVFPEFNHQQHSTIGNIRYLVSPLYLFLLVSISLTATTELGTQQWIESILGASGASPMLILALITGLMAVGRFYAGVFVHKLSPVGVLFCSAIIASLGIYFMSIATGSMVYLAAILFAIGVTYFWPTVLGCVAEYTPKTGAMGLSLAGGVGMFAVSMWSPVIGSWIDVAKQNAAKTHTLPEQIDLLAGQTVLSHLVIFPCTLIIVFAVLYFWIRNRTLSQS